MRNIQTRLQSNSIQHRESGTWFDTLISMATFKDVPSLDGKWLFDWKKEVPRVPVYKLVTVENPETIQGLMSVEENKGFLFVPLIENAPHNRGNNKEYRGIPGNLIAFVCKLSDERGYGGYVAFDAKTALKEHYRNTLGAQAIGHSSRMFIDEKQARELILFHFPKS
ncbi:MAG: hypothetical protein EPO28_14305 [Saprospiraceae bacterium]|nr:MAG: hypothetical protein EPO28_14305 [Saprospiraceae bacterium]